MPRPRIRVLLLGIGLAAGGASTAGTLHVTDQLLAGLYPEPDATREPVRLLSSGTPVEPLQHKGGYVRVRLPDHTTGWVEATYLTEDTPVQVLLLETQAKLQRLRREVTELQMRLEACARMAPEDPHAEHQPPAAQREEEATAEEPIASSQPRMVSIDSGSTQPMRYSTFWGLIALASACLVAFLGGMVFQDRRGSR